MANITHTYTEINSYFQAEVNIESTPIMKDSVLVGLALLSMLTR